MTIIRHLYAHYTRILATDLAKNDRKLWETYNPDEPIERLYTRLNKCVDYATTASERITEGQVVRISYDLVTETGQFQEDC